MGRLQEIENALASINESVFQELCDHFLSIRNKNISAFSRIGSQQGKQKTIIGTPDSVFLLPNGKYIFVEHSTNKSKGRAKLKEDIEKCLDEKKTGISQDQIAEIILCVNFKLKLKDFEELRKLLIRTRIRLSVYTLDLLAIELHLHHRDLVHQYLGFSLDTGQIVSIDNFIAEYNKASTGIATPLDNIFLHREQEVQKLNTAILNSDLIIVTGAPGVGKTKLALESIMNFVSTNANYKPYCISYKHHTLLDDLSHYIDSTNDYILFIDDANRIDAFEQVIGFFKAIRTNKLKLIITVRDYAYNEILNRCQQYSPVRVDVPKLADQQIIDIIASDSFKIGNTDYQNEIIRIADGNPRLAIMAALLANAHQNIKVLTDVSDLFEMYFSTFVGDKKEFENTLTISCLGIISFFYTLPYKDREFVEPILKDFNIDYLEFIEIIDHLDRLELVELQYEHVKIPEQNLATYFFYRAFIKDEYLSFQTLLEKQFESSTNRFRDTIIPANNTFGPNKVMEKLRPQLVSYWNSINNDETAALKFIGVFYIYLQTEALEYIYKAIEKLPAVNIDEFDLTRERDHLNFDKDKIIDLLSDFFRVLDKLKDTLELLFNYTRKKPSLIGDTVHAIREYLMYDREDFYDYFFRQGCLVDALVSGLTTGDKLITHIFYDLSPNLLAFKFDRTRGGRRNAIHIYNFQLPNEDAIQKLRVRIWNALNDNFSKHEESTMKVLSTYSGRYEVDPGLMLFESPYVIKIIETHLDPKVFKHCKWVQAMIRCWKHNGVVIELENYLKSKFTNDLYKVFLKLDWNRFRDKEMFDFEDYNQYEKLKENEIRTSFILNSKEEVKVFHSQFIYLREHSDDNWNYNNTLDMIVDANFLINFDIGCAFLEVIIEEDNGLKYVPRRPFHSQLNSKIYEEKIWSIIESREFNAKVDWELAFYDFIDTTLINIGHTSSIIKTFENISNGTLLHFERLKRYLDVKPDLFIELLKVIVNKNSGGQIVLKTWMNFFDDFFEYLQNDLPLVKKAFLQQNKDQSFDYQGKGFLKILLLDKSFLLDYLEDLYKQQNIRLYGDQKDLGFVWEVEGIEPVLEKAIDYLVETDPSLGILPHFSNSFFRNIKEPNKLRAKHFLLNYVSKNFSDRKKMNTVVDIARHMMRESFEEILLYFLTKTQDIKLFEKILWRGNGTSGVGDVILADIEAADWRNIINIVAKSDVGVALYPIKKYLNDRIDQCTEQAKWERKRRFLERY